jgi:hypothetical protein
MYNDEFAGDIRIISVSSTATATLLSELIRSTLASKSVAWPVKEIISVIITPSANLSVKDIETGDNLTVASNVSKEFKVLNAHDKLVVTNVATVLVEVYFGR